MDKNRIGGVRAGRAGDLPRSPYPSRVQSVDSATVHGKRLCLPQEICSVSLRRLRLSKGGLTAGQKSAEGILGRDVGKSSEALRMPKGGARIGQAGNDGRRPEREGEAKPETMAEGPNEKERPVGHESQGRQTAEYPDRTGLLFCGWVKPERREGKGLSRPGR